MTQLRAFLPWVLGVALAWLVSPAPRTAQFIEVTDYPIDLTELQPISIARLAPADLLEVEYVSRGCLSRTSSMLKFWRRTEGTLRVSVRTITGALDLYHRVVDVTLTEQEIASLDDELLYYRTTARKGMCDLSVDMILTLYRAGEMIRRERHHDSSCLRPYKPDRPQSFGRLAMQPVLDHLDEALENHRSPYLGIRMPANE
jgi:hypothetical protein